MKKLIALFLLGVSALLTGCSDNIVPVEGKQYSKLPANLSTYRLPQVTEVFSLNCGHCGKMEAEIPKLESMIDQSIGKIHITFNESAQIGAMIYYSAEMQLGHKPDHQMMLELFSAVQMAEGSTADRKGAIDRVFQSRDLISPYDLGEDAQTQLFQAMHLADEITAKGEISSVPTFIVNGKYLIITSGHENLDSIADTIQYLIKQ
ncbi:thioredoxin domain-containing protein [Vibrio renipiscarius]|uniref:Thiol-disulfide isomerase and thioredoxin n=1 Tax=Vibrio renipiscarius TaxID=1461322 RepID=A0A0C2NXX6_9VIBR|nr:thioredoxin domain-containing protein [Vibrio renipiscarius]KII75933.1 thiol-disulfide isomerase and thioredoxin [Vibrio renipiscarius]KII79037.1 thiol-disulfide isomerase and thioredoxin [Vibrio renipiscarius]